MNFGNPSTYPRFVLSCNGLAGIALRTPLTNTSKARRAYSQVVERQQSVASQHRWQSHKSRESQSELLDFAHLRDSLVYRWHDTMLHDVPKLSPKRMKNSTFQTVDVNLSTATLQQISVFPPFSGICVGTLEQEVARSNRVAPIYKDPENTAFSGSFLFPAWWFSFAGAQSQSAATRGLCKTWMQPTWCLWERASHSVCGTDPNPSGCPLRAGSVADMKALVFRSRPRGFGIKQRT